MNAEIHIRVQGRIGRITLNRPEALNALTHDMVVALHTALPELADNSDVSMLVIDAAGDRAFCAGGDIADIYQGLLAQNHEVARQFWRDEYRLNAALFHFPKPVATFLQGFTMGGGVGVGCHGSHRVVGDSARIAMPECGIGLVPDVGGSLILARAPGRLGEYLGTTGTRMKAGDAILAGFADYYIPEEQWPELIEKLASTGDWEEVDRAAQPPPHSSLVDLQPKIDTHFAGETHGDVLRSLRSDASEWASDTLKMLGEKAPLAAATTLDLVRRARGIDQIELCLTNEYRFGHRIVTMGDFQEGIRAAIIDKDKSPKWRHDTLDEVTSFEVSKMLMPLGSEELKWRGD